MLIDSLINIITPRKNKYNDMSKTDRQKGLLSKMRDTIIGHKGSNWKKSKTFE